MKKRKSTYLKNILEGWAEEVVPTSKIHLWPAIQSRLNASPMQSQKGLMTMQTTPRKPHLLWAAALIAATLVALTALFTTPSGKALTQSVLQFLNGSGGPATPLAITPSQFPPTSTATRVPMAFYAQCGDPDTPKCSLEQIRSMVAFAVKEIYGELPPSGMAFVGATGGPDQVWLLYRSDDGTRSLILLEGTKIQESFQGIQITGDIPVESVQISDSTGEYVKGAWSDASGSGTQTWDPNQPDQYLRWMSGGVYYEMDAFSNPQNPSYWSNQTGLLSLARSLEITHPQLTPVPVNAEGTPEPVTADLTIAQTEALAGFHLIVPDRLPRDQFSLHSASYSPSSKTVCLIYGSSLTIAESATAPFPNASQLFPTGFTWEVLTVGGGLDNKGLLIKGGLDPNQFCVYRLQSLISDYSKQTEVLQFQTQGMYISIYAEETPLYGDPQGFVTRLDLARLAENMTGVHTIPDSQLDPEYLTDVKYADAFAGFHILLPTILFKDEALAYIRVMPNVSPNDVMIYYQINLFINEIPQPIATLESLKASNPNFTPVTIRGQPGLVYINPGADIDIYWFENGIEYYIWAIYDNQPLETWVALANSFK